MEQKTYVFFRHRAAGEQSERIEKTESELTKAEKTFLLGSLVNEWNKNTKENQDKFLGMLSDEWQEKNVQHMITLMDQKNKPVTQRLE